MMHAGAKIIMKCIDPMFRKIDKLTGNHKVTSTDFFFQAATRIRRDDMGNIQILEGLNIRAIIDMGWAELMVTAVPGDKNNLHIVEPAGFDKDFAVWRWAPVTA
jgi:hypothetical protein